MDEALLLFFNHAATPLLDALVPLLTHRFMWVAMYVALAAAAVRTLGARRALVFLAAVAVAVTLADQVGATLIRPLVARPRPSHCAALDGIVRLVGGYRGGQYGFPSCHAANTVALTAMLLLRFRGRLLAATMIAWVAVQVWTRMYLGVHYPTDLVCGALLGLLSALLATRLAALATRRWLGEEPRREPLRWAALPVAVMLATVAVCMAVAATTVM